MLASEEKISKISTFFRTHLIFKLGTYDYDTIKEECITMQIQFSGRLTSYSDDTDTNVYREVQNALLEWEHKEQHQASAFS